MMQDAMIVLTAVLYTGVFGTLRPHVVRALRDPHLDPDTAGLQSPNPY
jgi:hypothetical protein